MPQVPMTTIGYDEMESLVSSLPTRADNDGMMKVFDNRRNVMTPKQVQEAKSKGWKVLEKIDNTWVDYVGAGDIDGNGQVDQNDLDITVRHIMGEPVTDQGNILKCDVNWDYSIDAVDVVLLLDIINWKK